MSEAITPWLHILAATIWVGPQFFLFLAAVPAIRTIEDCQTRARVMRIIVTRFGWLAWGAMAVIVLTGISNLFQVAADLNLNASDLIGSDYRFGRIFWEKMVLVGLTVLLTAVHTFIVGPRQMALNEQMEADPGQVSRLRRLSIATSSLSLLLSIAVVFLAAVLANHNYSFQPT